MCCVLGSAVAVLGWLSASDEQAPRVDQKTERLEEGDAFAVDRDSEVRPGKLAAGSMLGLWQLGSLGGSEFDGISVGRFPSSGSGRRLVFRNDGSCDSIVVIEVQGSRCTQMAAAVSTKCRWRLQGNTLSLVIREGVSRAYGCTSKMESALRQSTESMQVVAVNEIQMVVDSANERLVFERVALR
jgi:hypothetical protein